MHQLGNFLSNFVLNLIEHAKILSRRVDGLKNFIVHQ
jgi:hypothetical protein